MKSANDSESTERNNTASPEKIYRHNPDVVFRKIADEYLLVPVRRSVSDMDDYIYRLNKVGADIWELIDGNRKIPEIAKTIAGKYEITPEKAIGDILEYIDDLLDVDALIEIE